MARCSYQISIYHSFLHVTFVFQLKHSFYSTNNRPRPLYFLFVFVCRFIQLWHLSFHPTFSLFEHAVCLSQSFVLMFNFFMRHVRIGNWELARNWKEPTLQSMSLLSDFSPADWSGAIVDNSTDHRNCCRFRFSITDRELWFRNRKSSNRGLPACQQSSEGNECTVALCNNRRTL